MEQSREATLRGAKILIVEDEYFLADDLARALRDAGAKPVGPANSIQQAEDLIARDKPDAAIVDLNLRGKMASDFVSRLAATDVRCLIVSGYASDGYPETVSGIPRLEKPVSASSVLASLAAEMSRPA
jgi:DNA-binding response OmpR family regulator